MEKFMNKQKNTKTKRDKKNCVINVVLILQENIKDAQHVNKKNKNWYQNSQYRERNRILDIERRQLRKQKTFNHYGNKCKCCGETNHIFLSIDHINNDGADYRKEIFSSSKRGQTSGTAFYKWIEKK